MSDNKNDIPFEDSPPRPERDVTGEAADASSGADGKGDSDAADATASATASEERTPPGSGSTGPTGVREDLGTLADEARKLWSAIESRVVAPAVQSYPEVARHLGVAGREVAAAVRSAVRGSEQSWQTGGPGGDKAQEKITVERVDRIDPSEQKNRD
ncbi:DUF5304 family protein [Catenulispora sp. NF23]|uniref:DUF5304 family protein n=1 Tax=Catenulispora pinistramenti TaxID=2705254 RepID=A0ABS5KXT3_9ACTN|nr:DUF5304 family protein [Catenulispora pinistramenti]MBS2534238.1 DUF5304 family protein [Catenulispora pinistramenti]MBS2550834.1 DUF5304 family protein [Catenulispora pinistramenti]